MPTYCFQCDCGHKRQAFKPMAAAGEVEVCRCGQAMLRDYHAESVGVVTDPEMCQADIDRNIEQRSRNVEVDRPVLARSLSRVAGIPEVRGRDGKVYAFFRNRQERTRVLKRLGLPHDD